MVEHLLLLQWFIGSIPHGEHIKIISQSSQCYTTGVTKVMVCAILSGMMHIKDPLLLI